MRRSRFSFVRKKSFDYNVLGVSEKERFGLDQTAETQVLLDDDVCIVVSKSYRKVTASRYACNLPLTAAMTNRICVVSVAHVKCV